MKTAEASVVSTECTTTFPALGLELPAGEVVAIPRKHLPRVLAMPGVVETKTLNPESGKE